MFYSDVSIVRELINRASHEERPYLFAVNFEGDEALFVDNPLNQQAIGFFTPFATNKTAHQPSGLKGGIVPEPLSPGQYKRKWDIVREALLRGDTYLTNLTVRTPLQCTTSLEAIFFQSTSPYQLYVPERFVCFSPERFVKISSTGRISTNPMKGTIDATLQNAEQTLLADIKEIEEHNTIVDLLRNDLGMWAEDVRINRFRYVEKITTNAGELLQVSSEIEGQLPHDYRQHLGDILFDMLPAGSCTGAPKKSTVDLIHRTEGEPRGFYTGVFGYFDGVSLDSAVLIRFIEKTDGRFFFRSGGGITARSNWKDEYQEILQKIYLPL
jgi:Anthranilate/para-aminobenzoate synthases component I